MEPYILFVAGMGFQHDITWTADQCAMPTSNENLRDDGSYGKRGIGNLWGIDRELLGCVGETAESSGTGRKKSNNWFLRAVVEVPVLIWNWGSLGGLVKDELGWGRKAHIIL